jgi:hypothetical protein
VEYRNTTYGKKPELNKRNNHRRHRGDGHKKARAAKL